MTADTLGEELERSYAIFADRPAIIWNGTTITYREFDAAANRLADSYRRLGVTKGDRVVCQIPNGPEFLMSAAAAWKIGAVHVGADRDLAPVEVVRLVEMIRPSVLITSGRGGRDGPSLIGLLRKAADRVTIVCDGPGAPAQCLCLSELVAERLIAADTSPVQLWPEDPAVILLTSGTTGQPKGVIRHHGQLLHHWSRTARLLMASPEDRHLVQLPLAHGFGFGLAVAGLLSGGLLVGVDRFSAEPTLDLIDKEKITILNGTPAHYKLLLDSLDRSRHDVSSVRCGSGSAARFPPGLLARIFDEFGMDFVHTYGCSEGLGWKTTDKDEMLRGSVGRPPPNNVRVVGPGGKPVPPGEVGEIVVRKTHRVEYWGKPPPGSADPVWHHMGDLGRFDHEGFLYVLGRKSLQINRGGLKIDPGEVEPVLLTHEELRDAAVVGFPDSVVGEMVCACIVPRQGVGPDLEELRAYLASSLATHKLPEKLCVMEQIPRTEIGKVDRAALLKLATQQQGAKE